LEFQAPQSIGVYFGLASCLKATKGYGVCSPGGTAEIALPVIRKVTVDRFRSSQTASSTITDGPDRIWRALAGGRFRGSRCGPNASIQIILDRILATEPFRAAQIAAVAEYSSTQLNHASGRCTFEAGISGAAGRTAERGRTRPEEMRSFRPPEAHAAAADMVQRAVRRPGTGGGKSTPHQCCGSPAKPRVRQPAR
jgi:hypothetical protein